MSVMTNKINRNDLCYCGSGKKYKKCCLNAVRIAPTWKTEASKVEIGQHQDEISNAFFVVSDFLKENPIQGACHLISSIFYILLKEQDVECDLCIGEVRAHFGVFDHSWVQVNDDIYDIAIQIHLSGIEDDPVFAGYDLGTGKETESIYGIGNGSGLDADASLVLNMPFVEYLDGAPVKVWNITRNLLRKLNVTKSADELREKYKNTERILITTGK